MPKSLLEILLFTPIFDVRPILANMTLNELHDMAHNGGCIHEPMSADETKELTDKILALLGEDAANCGLHKIHALTYAALLVLGMQPE